MTFLIFIFKLLFLFLGTLLGWSNTVAFFMATCAPIIVGALTSDQVLIKLNI